MAKFNQNVRGSNRQVATTNRSGGIAYDTDSRQKLLGIAFKGAFGRSENPADTVRRLLREFPNACPKFMINLAAFTRNELGNRTSSHVFATVAEILYQRHLASGGEQFEGYKDTLYSILRRPDDCLEIASCYMATTGGKLSPRLCKVFKKRLENFSDFQIARYQNGNSALKLADLVKMVRPSGVSFEHHNIFGSLISGELEAPSTLENDRSRGTSYIEIYRDGIANNSLGYVARVKGLRNLLNEISFDMSPENMSLLHKVQEFLMDTDALKRSKMLPHRLQQAYDEIYSMGNRLAGPILSALDFAIRESCVNIGFTNPGEKVVVALDESGSMSWGQGGLGEPFKFGALLTAGLVANVQTRSVEDGTSVDVILWANDSRDVDVSRWGSRHISEVARSLRTGGGGTDVHAPLVRLYERRQHVDKLIILTDMQLYDANGYSNGDPGMRTFSSILERYRRDVNPNIKVVFWDLTADADNVPYRIHDRVFQLHGNNLNMVNYLDELLDDPSAILNRVESFAI